MQAKLTAYSLNPGHELGTHKAMVFQRALSITLDDADYLADQLLAGICEAPVSDVRDNAPYGVLCEVLVSVRDCAIWQIASYRSQRPGSTVCQLVLRVLSPPTSRGKLTVWPSHTQSLRTRS